MLVFLKLFLHSLLLSLLLQEETMGRESGDPSRQPLQVWVQQRVGLVLVSISIPAPHTPSLLDLVAARVQGKNICF